MKTIILLIAVTFGSGIEADFVPIQPFASPEACLEFVAAIESSPIKPEGLLICVQALTRDAAP